ncbi:MAG TPA: alcohol dehydrogenase catalytic domain-containing protein, partial [Candidatus Latescibacteria bacterium]|nr:alcohol dehydrogenase catalytic domain-containing protein [Candidatus Latescibacterota bacterium]
MRAVVYGNDHKLSLQEMPVPSCPRNGLLAKVHACAICGSDVKMFKAPDPRVKPPQIVGHEFVGEIVEVGSDAKGFAVGDRVVMATTLSCMACPACWAGKTNLCPNVMPVSRAFPGAFAPYIAIPWEGIRAGNTVKVPSSLEDDGACLAEPLSCAVNAQQLAGVRTGQTVVVVGGGPLGELNAELAKANGATRVIVSQRSATRQDLLRELDLDAVIDAASCDPVEEVKRLTNGRGADVVIVTAPDRTAQERALEMACKGGMVNFFAGMSKDDPMVTINSRLVHYNEISITGGSDSTARHVEIAVGLLAAGRVNWKKIVTHRFPLSRFFDGMQVMLDRAGLKVVIKPSGGRPVETSR